MTDIQKENKSGGKVPNLRFPGFFYKWEITELTGLGEFLGGGTPSSSNDDFWKGNVPWISSSDLSENNIHSVNVSRFITEEAINNSATKLCSAPVILIVSRVGVGKVAYSGKSLCTSQDFLNIINFKCNGIFLSYLLSTEMKKAASAVQGTSIKGISSVEIKSKKLYIPKISEQNKIASFLSLIDERITTQSKILLHLKSLIESLNDSLSEQKIRINSNFENWKKVRLGDLGYTFNGLSGKTKEDFGNGKRYIQYKQIFDSSKIVIENCGYVNVSENENQNSVKYGDIFFTISSETPDEIGMSSVLLEDVKNVYLNSFCFGFRLNSFKELLPEFARFLFRSKVVRNEIKKLAQGSTRYNMSKTELLKLEILLPSIKEQKEISTFLGSLYQKIQTEKTILEQLEIQKKYLLQQMFV